VLTREQQELIDEELGYIENIPTLPDIAFRINELVNDPDTSMRQLESVIEMDPMLSSAVLKVVNSSFYGMAREISSLRLALVILGIREIKNLVLSLTVFQSFKDFHLTHSFDYKQFWLHSAVTGQIAKSLAKKLYLKFEGAEFVGGLIHDIGKIVMLEYDTETYSALLDGEGEPSHPLWTREEDHYGFHHGQVGGWLAGLWRLPRRLVAAVLYHIEPDKSPHYQQLVGIVSLANALAHRLEHHSDIDDYVEIIPEHPATDVLMNHTSGLETIDWEQFSRELQSDLERAWEFVRLSQQSLWQTA